ncbi:hypothetical protein M6G63_28145 (plasmid) [Pseudomonas sp. BYT-5]|uniref:hypothetical protein n=1 Tax=Pseudomonas sp. BYT-5 TaxID=2944392 RepID=UPI0020219DC3|nr:hypothetical protein [Pseudomonas sp. BYT-5]URD45718.1 hypothetical protein M6G63_28145 [Pseudomonas sp. BYT-5]
MTVKTDLLTELLGSRIAGACPVDLCWLGSPLVTNDDEPRSLRELVVPLVGSLEATDDVFAPFGWWTRGALRFAR